VRRRASAAPGAGDGCIQRDPIDLETGSPESTASSQAAAPPSSRRCR